MRESEEVLGRYLHIGLGVVKLRVMVAPLVIVLFGDFARLQHGSSLLPGAEHLMQPGGVLVLPHIDLQADFSIHLADLEPVVILQGKQGVHQPHIGVYIRDGERMGRDIQYLGYLIAYVWHPASNARELVEYAKKREKKGSLIITLIKSND